MTLRDLLVISGLCLLTEDADEAIRLTLKKEIIHLFGEDAFERLSAIEASDEDSEEVMLQILRSLAVDQELLDVKAGIPARDAEIEALRKEIEALKAAQAQQAVSGADGLPIERVLIDGTAYELPSAVAAELLRLHLEILGAEQELAALAQQDADKEDAEPDMFWNADNPEQCQDSIHNLLVEVQCDRTLRVGDIVEIQQAMSLPNISVRVTAVDGEDDDGDLRYEIVNDAAINAARKEAKP